MGKLFRLLLFIIYAFSILPTAGALLGLYISPNAAWPLAFMGLIFPILLIVQFFFIILFLLLRSKAVFIPVILVLVCWTPVTHTLRFNPEKKDTTTAEGNVRIMTYNVRLLDFFNWSGQKNTTNGIFETIRKYDPDILCLQEMVIQETGRFSLSRIREELNVLPHEYVEYNFVAPNRKHGMAIFSRYPVISSWSEHFPGTHNMVMYADLAVGQDTVRIFNNHLESIHFERDEFQIIDNKSDESRITREKISVIFERMKTAYKRRAIQAEMVHQKIKESPHPLIVCGDFNDTPVSYAVNKVRNGLYDSFRSGGSGMGFTFPNLILPMRIDYILHDKSIVSTSFQTGKEKLSDHRPVVASLKLGK
jgi:endonuclease/exonuclease/phosphatase family metal-dependent hydrolase